MKMKDYWYIGVIVVLLFACFFLLDRCQQESGYSAQHWALSLGMTADGAKEFRHDFVMARLDGKKLEPYNFAKDRPWTIDWDNQADSPLACATRQGQFGSDPNPYTY